MNYTLEIIILQRRIRMANKHLKKLLDRKLIALMNHQDWANIFWLCGFNELAEEQELRYQDENKGFRELQAFCIEHLDEVIEVDSDRTLIDKFKSKMFSDKRYVVKDVYDKWMDWELGTRDLTEELISDLRLEGYELYANRLLVDLIDVDNEITEVRREKKKLESMNYDLTWVLR
jgi:hypothetical protein